jgi:hypothetical protein
MRACSYILGASGAPTAALTGHPFSCLDGTGTARCALSIALMLVNGVIAYRVQQHGGAGGGVLRHEGHIRAQRRDRAVEYVGAQGAELWPAAVRDTGYALGGA